MWNGNLCMNYHFFGDDTIHINSLSSLDFACPFSELICRVLEPINSPCFLSWGLLSPTQLLTKWKTWMTFYGFLFLCSWYCIIRPWRFSMLTVTFSMFSLHHYFHHSFIEAILASSLDHSDTTPHIIPL